MFLRPTAAALTLIASLLLSGCDLEALLADPKLAQREADAKAVGGACRHGLRSIEDCYSLNEKSPRAAIFAGWKDMDQYMRDNKIEGVVPQGLRPTAVPAPAEEVIIDDAKAKAAATKAATKAKAAH